MRLGSTRIRPRARRRAKGLRRRARARKAARTPHRTSPRVFKSNVRSGVHDLRQRGSAWFGSSKPPWARNISEIGKALGAGWKALSAEERARYAELAAALKKQFEEVDLPAAIKKAEEEEEARVEAEAAEEKRAREAAAAAAAAVVAAREERLEETRRRGGGDAAAREERRRNRASEPTVGGFSRRPRRSHDGSKVIRRIVRAGGFRGRR